MASLKKTVQETLSINGLDVAIRGNGDENDYISLTDLAREKVGPEGDPRFAIGNWMRLKDTDASERHHRAVGHLGKAQQPGF